MKFIERDTLHICGYVVETDAAHNADDLSRLYKDFFDNDKESVLLSLHGSKKGFYGLMWYTQGHEKYCYLLGLEVDGECKPPDSAILKTITKTTYAVACYPHDKDAIEAWSEFFFTDIPNEGYVPNEQLNLYFEYFPESVDGDYELWVPVVKSMYERLLDKDNEPTMEQVEEYLGSESYKRLLSLEKHLQTQYHLTKEIRFPFGNSYGWGYKYSHKSSHLCYAFFEKGAFTITIQSGDKQVHSIENALSGLSHKAQELWTNRYPCGENGGWIHYRVMSDEELTDIYSFIHAKKKPV